MNKRSKIALAVLGVAAVGTVLYAATPSFSQGRGFGYGYGGYGPCPQRSEMAPMGYGQQGMMGPGYGGRGMHRQWGHHGGWGQKKFGHGKMMGRSGQMKELATPLTVEDVRAQIERRLEWRGNDRLKVGVVEQQGNWIIAEIVTVDDSLVRKIQVDPKTGMRKPVR